MPHETPTQPKLASLLARFLNERAQAQKDGLAGHDSGADAPLAEVTPYDAGPVQPIDAKLAWTEAMAAAAYFPKRVDVNKWPVPPDWASLVAGHEPVVALAFCLGNFPQLVRNFHLMLQNSRHTSVPVATGPALIVPALVDWTKSISAKKQWPHTLLALASLRLARNFDHADAFVASNDGHIPLEWRAVWENEKAALAWHQGRADAARALWNTMEPCVPILFNRGMADVFGGDAARGRAALDAVAAQIPDTSAWHHLARLYGLLGASRNG
jgi:hypothetical protein